MCSIAALSLASCGDDDDSPAASKTGGVAGAAQAGTAVGYDSDLIRMSLGDRARMALEALMATMQGYEYQSEFHRRAEAETRAQAVLEFLEARGVTVNAEQRERITECMDLGTLRRWIKRAATISTADELFE